MEAGWQPEVRTRASLSLESPTESRLPRSGPHAPRTKNHTARPLNDLSASTQRNLAIALIILATLHALVWSFVREPGSGGPDERSHFRVVNQMVATGALAEFKGYEPGKFATGPVRAQVAHEITPNALAIPVALTLRAIGSDDPSFNIHIARLFMVALYPATLWLSFLTLRRVFPNMRTAPVWGVTIMAAVPMFTLVHSYYTNDAPAIAASTLTIYALVRASQSGFADQDTALLAIALGFVALHKYTGLITLPFTLLVLVSQLVNQPVRLLKVILLISAIIAFMSSWWYIRNWIIYGDPIGVTYTQAAVDASGRAPIPPRTRGLNVIEFIQETNWIGENFATFWAGYGLERLKLPGAAYLAISSLIVMAILGLSFRVIRRTHSQDVRINSVVILTLAGMHGGLWLVSFWSSYAVDVALSGRYVFPTFLPFVVLLILGLSGFIAWRGRPGVIVLLTVPIMLAASSTYFIQTILPDVNS